MVILLLQNPVLVIFLNAVVKELLAFKNNTFNGTPCKYMSQKCPKVGNKKTFFLLLDRG